MNGGIIGKNIVAGGCFTIIDNFLDAGHSRIREHAVSFDGTDDYASLGCLSFGSLLSNFSFELWIKTETTIPVSVFGSITSDTSEVLEFSLNRKADGSTNSGYLRIYIRNQAGSSSEGISTSGACGFNDGAWHHIAFTATPGSKAYYLYLDGSSVSLSKLTNVAVSNFANFSYPLVFGARNYMGSVGDFTPAILDEFRLWKDIRSQAEIQEYMKKRVDGSEDNLYGAWHLNEGKGALLADVIGSNNGTLVDGTWVPRSSTGWWDEV